MSQMGILIPFKSKDITSVFDTWSRPFFSLLLTTELVLEIVLELIIMMVKKESETVKIFLIDLMFIACQ